MNQLTPEKLRELLRNLPSAVREYYESERLSERIEEVANENDLTVSMSWALASEIGNVLIGFKPMSDFKRSIRERLELDPVKLDDLVKSVDEKIFEEVRQSLKSDVEKEDSSLDKEDIMREIEGYEVKPEVEKQEEVVLNNDKDFLSHNIEPNDAFEEKLLKPVSSEKKEEVVEETLKTKYKGTDPYREEIQ